MVNYRFGEPCPRAFLKPWLLTRWRYTPPMIEAVALRQR
jgi:hypothetical protein